MYTLVKLRHSKRVRGLPPNFTFVSEGNPMEVVDQGAATTSQVGDHVVVESGVPYSSHLPPLVKQPSWGNLPSKPKLPPLLLRLLRFLLRSILFKVLKPWVIKRKVEIEIKNLETKRRLHDQPMVKMKKGK